jgi:hypothetical protein
MAPVERSGVAHAIGGNAGLSGFVASSYQPR